MRIEWSIQAKLAITYIQDVNGNVLHCAFYRFLRQLNLWNTFSSEWRSDLIHAAQYSLSKNSRKNCALKSNYTSFYLVELQLQKITILISLIVFLKQFGIK